MPKGTEHPGQSIPSGELLEKAFRTFQSQCEMLEKSHADLKNRLAAAQLDLQRKNEELAARLLELEAIRNRLAGTLESITDAVFIVDPATATATCANGCAGRLLEGLAPAVQSLLDLDPVARLIHAGVKINDRSISFRLNGETRYWIISIAPMPNKATAHVHEVVSIKDVTEEKNLEVKLAREDRMAALGKVAASVAHEIRNPLAAIEGFAVLLERDLADRPRTRSLASKTIYAARQLNSVVGNLLTYTREYRPTLTLCSIRDIVNDTVGFIAPMADDHGVEVKVQYADDLPGVRLDLVMMRQVFVNLLTNAIEACPRKAGGRVCVAVSAGDDRISVILADNGEGVPFERKKKIFEPFYTTRTGGIGLGLALCQRIVEAHDGTIREDGVPGEGARFQVELKSMERNK